MAKKYTHFNNSGSNHKILDAESAYVTGTLQVGPAIPTLGSDVNFFVSGNIGGKDGATPGVGVFGGDLIVSGAIWALSGVQGVNSYWASETAGEIFTSASLVNVPSGSVHAQFLSSSNGAEISGSVLVDLSQGPNFSFVISGSGNGLPAFDVVSPGNIPGEEHSMFVVDPTNNRVRALSLDPSNYINMELGTPALQVISGSHQIDLNPNFDRIAFFVSASAATGSISVIDDNSNIGELQLEATTLNLYINGLAISGDPGVAGYALTSSGPGVAPGWAPFPTSTVASEYWFSSGSGAIATTGSVALVGADYINLAYDTASDYGADIFLYVSGDIYGRTNSGQGVAVFGGDTVVSGVLFADNKLKVYDGPGGPILELDNGPGQASFYVSITGSNGMLLTGSAVFAGAGVGISVGSDTVFFVSGNNGGVVAGNGVAVFEGDVVVSGALYAKDDVDVVGKLVVSGNAVFAQGMTGSIQWVDEAGTLPFLVAGPNTTVNFNPYGQWEITGSDESQPEWYYTANTGEIATSGSAAITGSLAVTGAAYFSPAGTGRGLLNFGGLDIGPITGSLTLAGATQTGYAVGDVLSASNGAGPNAVVEHEMHVLAVGKFANTNSYADHFFSATYLVTSKIDDVGIQSLIGSVELTRESSGSFVNQWDVNVESDMKVALTGTMNNGGLNEVRWFVERTRERSKKW
jgi:hypothetical protein